MDANDLDRVNVSPILHVPAFAIRFLPTCVLGFNDVTNICGPHVVYIALILIRYFLIFFFFSYMRYDPERLGP